MSVCTLLIFLNFQKFVKFYQILFLILLKARVGGYVVILISREMGNMRKVCLEIQISDTMHSWF